MAGFVVLKRLLKISAALVAAVCLTAFSAFAADLQNVRFGPSKDKTRIVFDLDGAVTYALSGDESGQGRLYVDFDSLTLRADDKQYKDGKGHIVRYGFADRGRAGVRAVFEFKNTAKVEKVFLLEPKGEVKKHRLVVDLATADKVAFMASLPEQYGDLTLVIEQATASTPRQKVAEAKSPATKQVTPPTPSRKGIVPTPVPAKPVLPKRVVVIDPGHGGRDPGSQGQSGTYEKAVTMKAAIELKAILEKRGDYEVVLTRASDKDPRIKSSQREELARREKLARDAGKPGQKKLFISLHADAIGQAAIRGASVYTLSDEGTERSAKMAKSQGNYHAYNLDLEQIEQDNPFLGDILLDKAQDHTLTNSSKFAQLLIENLTGKTPMLNRSHRKGDLRVLLAADVPAVLLELAFISNAKDESNLNSPVWRKRVMTAVADSIDSYFEDQEPSRHAAARSGASK